MTGHRNRCIIYSTHRCGTFDDSLGTSQDTAHLIGVGSRDLSSGMGVQGEGVFLGNCEDSVWEDWASLNREDQGNHQIPREDWGTLGKIRGITRFLGKIGLH